MIAVLGGRGLTAIYSHTPILGGDKVKLPNEVQWGSRMGQQDGEESRK